MSSNTKRYIVEETTSGQCLICNVKLNHPTSIKAHFDSKKHKKNVTQYVLQNDPALSTASDVLDEKGIVPVVYQKPQTYTCDVCKTTLDSKSLKESHVKEFPHADLLELKRDLMRKGCPSDFYTLYLNKYIYCLLCQKALECTSNVKSHCDSAKHKKKLDLWLVKPVKIPEHISKWYYCKICDKNLGGTSDYNNHIHYLTQSRPITAPANAQASVVKPATPESKKATVPTNPINLLNTTDWPSLSSGPDSKSDQKTPDLRAQIFTELEKLVQTLYYSNKLPEQVSLEYLKKVNQEVKTLIENRAKSDSVKTTNASNVVVPKVKTVADTVSTNQIKKTESKELKPQTQVTLPAPVTPLAKVLLPAQVQPSEKTLKKEEPKLITKLDTPFSNLLTEIVDEKHRLQKAGKQNNAAKLEVISEIEILLLQISEPKLPLQEILVCLTNFNKTIDIDLDCMKKQGSQPCIGM